VLEIILQESRAEVARWEKERVVPLRGPLAMDAQNADIALYLRVSGLERVVDDLWHKALDENRDEHVHADRIRTAVLHLLSVAAEAHNVRRRLIENVPAKAAAGMSAIEAELAKARREAKQAR